MGKLCVVQVGTYPSSAVQHSIDYK